MCGFEGMYMLKKIDRYIQEFLLQKLFFCCIYACCFESVIF